VEHGLAGLMLYGWVIWELFRLSRSRLPQREDNGLLNRQFYSLWPILLAVYLINALFVVMNYQFVNGLIFTMAGMLAAQEVRLQRETRHQSYSLDPVMRSAT
jgi:hypothetical protein